LGKAHLRVNLRYAMKNSSALSPSTTHDRSAEEAGLPRDCIIGVESFQYLDVRQSGTATSSFEPVPAGWAKNFGTSWVRSQTGRNSSLAVSSFFGWSELDSRCLLGWLRGSRVCAEP